MKKFSTLITILLTTILFSSCGLFYMNEPAPPLYLPERTEIIEILLYDNTEDDRHFRGDSDAILTSNEQIDFVLNILANTTPTKKESVNDSPYVDEFLLIHINTNSSSYHFSYLYKRERYFGLITQWYIEQPYRGIYEISEEEAQSLLNLL